jgi:hypothetical protein
MRNSLVIVCISNQVNPRGVLIVVELMQMFEQEGFVLDFLVNNAKASFIFWSTYHILSS